MSNFNTWVDGLAKKEPQTLHAGETVKSSAGEPFGTVRFVKVQRKHYFAEVAKKGDFYIYHFFFPSNEFPSDFSEKLGDAFVKVFKRPEQIEAEYVDEMKSWAVRVGGYANTVWGEDLAPMVFDALDQILET